MKGGKTERTWDEEVRKDDGGDAEASEDCVHESEGWKRGGQGGKLVRRVEGGAGDGGKKAD